MIYSLTVTNSIGESLTFELSNPWASGYAIKNIDGLGTPDMNVNSTPYGIGDGSVLGSIKAEYRLITIILYPLALPTVETSRQRLYRYFQMKKKILLTFNTENRLVHINGYVQNISPNIFDNPESISIEIKCLNPYFYKMNDDQTKFYGIQPTFEFIFSNEFVLDKKISDIEWEETFDIEWEEISLASLLPRGGVPCYLVYGKDKFVITTNEKDTFYSFDGIEWFHIDLAYSFLNTVYGDEKFVGLTLSNNYGLYSYDGITWYETNRINITGCRSIIYGKGRFVALSNRGVSIYSDDGIVWNTGIYHAGIYTDYYALAYGDGKFVALPSSGSKGIYSYDGIEWEVSTLPTSANWYSLVYGNDKFIGISKKTSTIIVSKDGAEWEIYSLPMALGNTVSAIYANDCFMIMDGDTNTILYGRDGVNWRIKKISNQTGWDSLAYGNGKILSINSNAVQYGVISKKLFSPEYLDPIEFSQFTIDNRMTIEYEGEVDAGIKITIECQTPPGDIIIYNVETLQYIQIFAERIEAASGAPLGPKDIIEINTESGEKYVRLLRNGIYYNVLGAMNRGMTWFVLKQGPNTFTYTTTDEHAAISMTFSYRDTYAAI